MMNPLPETFPPLQEKIIMDIRSSLSDWDFICTGYLFGSFLRSDTWHDIDLALYLFSNPDPFERYKLINRIGQAVEKTINPRIHVDVRIMNRAPVSFVYEVLSTGLLLISNDDEKTAEFEADILIRYLDIQPWNESLDQWYREALAG